MASTESVKQVLLCDYSPAVKRVSQKVTLTFCDTLALGKDLRRFLLTRL